MNGILYLGLLLGGIFIADGLVVWLTPRNPDGTLSSRRTVEAPPRGALGRTIQPPARQPAAAAEHDSTAAVDRRPAPARSLVTGPAATTRSSHG